MHGPDSRVDKKIFRLSNGLQLVVGSFEMREKSDLAKMLLGDVNNSGLLRKGSLNGLTFLVPGRDVDYLRDYRIGVVDGKMDVDVVRVLYIKPWTSEEDRQFNEANRDARVQWQNRFGQNFLKQNSPENIYGMKCFRDPENVKGWREMECLAERDADEWMIVKVGEIYEGGAPNPSMHAKYYSKAHGGIEISWITSARNVQIWKEIDQKLWKLINQKIN